MGNEVSFNENEMVEMLERNYEKAEKILENEDKMEKILQRLEKKLKAVPVAGDALAYIPVMISLIKMYVKKEYKELPIASVLAVFVALIYWLSPIDLIPDFIPGIGLIDDTAVISLAVIMVKTDLDDYLAWRRENGMEVADLPDYEEIDKSMKGKYEQVRAFFAGKKAQAGKDANK